MLLRAGLDAIVALLDHALKDDAYSNGIISGLAVLGIRDDGG